MFLPSSPPDLLRRRCLGLAAAACATTLSGPVDAQTRIDFGQPRVDESGTAVPNAPNVPSTPSAPHTIPHDSPHPHVDLQQEIDRRALGRMPGAGPSPQAPSVADFWSAPRQIWLSRRATGQSIKAVWWANGQVQPQAYRDLSFFLGDPLMAARIRQILQRGQPLPAHWHPAVWISPVVLDTLYALGAWLTYFGMARPIEVTSGFRHPLTNAAIEGAARDSLHQIGAAVDVVVPGVSAQKVAQFGAWMRGGGVGVYPQRGFTHLDAGRVRSWRGR